MLGLFWCGGGLCSRCEWLVCQRLVVCDLMWYDFVLVFEFGVWWILVLVICIEVDCVGYVGVVFVDFF